MGVHKNILYFSNFNLREREAQITVRRGVKWADLEVGDIVFTTSTNKPEGLVPFYDGFIRVLDVKVYKFKDIPPELLEKEHDDNCKTIEGLFEEMSNVYGNNFNANEIVTVIEFQYHRTNSL
jgi:hypothetical protein